MGNVCGCGSPQTKPAQPQERQYTTSVGQSLQGKDVKNQSQKIGLAGTHQAVKLLGRGAAADIWLFRDLKHGNQVAVKLFERPIPQAAVQAVLREIKVNLCALHEGTQPVLKACSNKLFSVVPYRIADSNRDWRGTCQFGQRVPVDLDAHSPGTVHGMGKWRQLDILCGR